jgi:hypothetical protein
MASRRGPPTWTAQLLFKGSVAGRQALAGAGIIDAIRARIYQFVTMSALTGQV